MVQKNYIWYNGDILDGNNNVISISNRSFRYGDGLFETIHAFGTQGRNLKFHMSRLIRSMDLLHIDVPTYLDEAMLSKEITRLLNKNRFFGSTRVRVTVFRDSPGLYTPDSNLAGIIIEATPLEKKMYELNPRGYIVDIYPDIRKPLNPLSSIKSCNSLLYILAGIYRHDNRLSDCLLINELDRIVEGISSNVFIVKGDSLFTPAVAEGCIPGVMREVILKAAPKIGLKVFNNIAIPIQKLLDCDEIFLTNTIDGIRWVVAFRQQRYFSKVSRLLIDEVNRFTFPDQFKDGFSG